MSLTRKKTQTTLNKKSGFPAALYLPLAVLQAHKLLLHVVVPRLPPQTSFTCSIFCVSWVLSLSQVWSNTVTCLWGGVLVSYLRHLVGNHTGYPGLSFCFGKPHTTVVTFSSVTIFNCYKLGFLAQIFQNSECLGALPVELWIRLESWSGGPACTAVWCPLRNP